MMESATVDAGRELQQSATDDLKQIQVEGDCLAICGFAATGKTGPGWAISCSRQVVSHAKEVVAM